jgi:hypothetical protein
MKLLLCCSIEPKHWKGNFKIVSDEYLQKLKDWCNENQFERMVALHIQSKDFCCMLKDKTANHGCGHTYVGIGYGSSLPEAIDKAFECYGRWSENT